MVCVAVTPPTGVGYAASKRSSAWLQSANGGGDRRKRNNLRNGTSAATHLDHFTPLHGGEDVGEVVLNVTDIERPHVIQNA